MGDGNIKRKANVLLRQKQYAYTGTAIAQHIVQNKIGQQITMLGKRREKSEKLKEALIKLQEYYHRLPDTQLGSVKFLVSRGLLHALFRTYVR